MRDDPATDRALMTDETGEFGTHPWKRFSGLAGGLCDSLRAKAEELHHAPHE
jgi:hypothetical protein